MSRRRVVFATVVLLAAVMLPAPAAHAADACTRVIGGSQTTNWYTNGEFESLVVDAEWERQTRGGNQSRTGA